MAQVWKLLTLFAVLLMPLSMPAAAATPRQHHAAAMPTEHCPEQGPKQEPGKAGLVECTMVCSSALPVGEVRQSPQPLLLASAPEMSRATPMPPGLQPETATPPPKAF